MTKKKPTISDKKRYVLRMLELAEQDPQIKQLMPDPSVRARIGAEGLTLDRMIDAALTGYAERPALGERAYKIEQSIANNTTIRHYLPSFKTITYAELQARIKAVASAWRYHHPTINASGTQEKMAKWQQFLEHRKTPEIRTGRQLK